MPEYSGRRVRLSASHRERSLPLRRSRDAYAERVGECTRFIQPRPCLGRGRDRPGSAAHSLHAGFPHCDALVRYCATAVALPTGNVHEGAPEHFLEPLDCPSLVQSRRKLLRERRAQASESIIRLSQAGLGQNMP
jgi:hypothetical protein